MKEESVLNVLMYLFKNHMQVHCELDLLQAKLLLQLEELGFRRKVINQAFEWLENLSKNTREAIPLRPKNSLRIYTDLECDLLSTECRSFLILLEQQGILNPHSRELVISQVLELNAETIDIGLLKWVTLMVLFNQPDEKRALACMEFLVLDDTIGGIH
ncbi:MAG: hypothetical protein A3F17_07215 [Gammaproteobacteria bacterium RIFCSPHIGHO2_12_FULL_41_15]|nr:MAG: hypothetical protein A3F17_07215 [Gammaproteobacteria bacterium RIFCSPHIGHO2_12_FULL_41_15]